MKHLPLILFVAAAALTVEGAAWRFRSGEIVAAELTRTAPYIRDLDPLAFPALPKDRVYAVLSVRPDAGRPLSIFDYSLEDRDVVHPCVALNTGSGFVSTDRNVSGAPIVQLLFILDAGNARGDVSLTLKCNLPPANGIYDLKVPFRRMGFAAPTLPSRIPAEGMMGSRDR